VSAERRQLRPETIAVKAGRGPGRPGDPLGPPLVMASTFHAGGEGAYARTDGTPTWRALEEAIGELEGGQAVAFASGMAAVSAVLETLPIGARVVHPTVSYLGVRRLVGDRASAGRLEATPVDVTDPDAVVSALDGASMLWIETPTNPLVGIADLERLAAAARDLGIPSVVDNTFATPLLQRPLEFGCDVVVHSATKLIGGHSDLLLGIAVCRDSEPAEVLRATRHDAGATPGGLEAWLALRGLRTLPVRLAQAQATAVELARRLDEHPEVERVFYPGLTESQGHELAQRQMDGFGTMLAFQVRGGSGRADGLCAAVQLLTHATSLGGVETLIENRAAQPGEEHLPEGLLRVSVGCEHPDDLWEDLDAALESSTA
jgi:cystathionine gamma-synthase